MPIPNSLIPFLVTARMQEKYRDAIVHTARTNRTWQNDLKEGGSEVRLWRAGNGVVKSYDTNTGDAIDYEDAEASAGPVLTIDNDEYWAVKIEDHERAESVINYIDPFLDEQAIALANTVDNAVRTRMVSDAVAGPAIALDHSAVFTAAMFKVHELHRVMDLHNMPREGRWCIVGPYTAEALTKFSLQNEVLNANTLEQLRNGQIGNFGGITWYTAPGSDSTYDSSTPADLKATETWLYGNDTAIAFIDRLDTAEQLPRQLDRFADYWRGRYQFGVKKAYDNRLFKSTCAITHIGE